MLGDETMGFGVATYDCESGVNCNGDTGMIGIANYSFTNMFIFSNNSGTNNDKANYADGIDNNARDYNKA